MRSFTTLMFVRAMEEELRRQVRPRRSEYPVAAPKAPRRETRSWSMILSFPRLQPSIG
jgi:hypothetical protein